jgi:hypothetical protein
LLSQLPHKDGRFATTRLGTNIEKLQNPWRFAHILCSEMDGWRHAYICSRDGTEQTLLTPGDYDVIEKVRKTPSFVE